MTNLQGIYFYNGFCTPEKVATTEIDLEYKLNKGLLNIDDNYTGSANIEIIDMIKNETPSDLAADLQGYDLFINPELKTLQKLNTNVYGLDKNEYLQKFL